MKRHNPALKVDTAQLNRAFGTHQAYKLSLHAFGGKNTTGVFQELKYDRASKKNVKYYYVTAPGKPVDKPKPGTKWWDSILPSQNPVRGGIISTGASSTMTVDDNDVDDEVDDGFDDEIDNGIDGTTDGTTEETDAGTETVVTPDRPTKRPRVSPEEIRLETYWQQSEAWVLFDPNRQYPTVLEAITARIEALRRMNSHADAWQTGVEMKKEDVCLVSSHQIFSMRQRAVFLIVTLERAQENMAKGKNFEWCCKGAVKELNHLSLTLASSHEVVRRWHMDFRDRGNKFGNPNPLAHKGHRPLLFEHYPDGQVSFCTFANENLAKLSGELMLNYVLEKLVPVFRAEYNNHPDHAGLFEDDDAFLNHLGYRNLGVSTMNRWLNNCGYKYCTVAKGYYNDKHEEPANRLYREEFIDRYFKDETRCFRWIQISKDEQEQLVQQGKLAAGSGYHYNDATTGDEMVEFHVDVLDDFQRRMNGMTNFGGRLSVRKDPDKKPLIQIGQDECIVKQFIFRHKQWVGPNGERPLLPKDEGQGVMLSAFTSREFGFGFKMLTDNELAIVNDKRDGTFYSDKDAAISLGFKEGKKMPLDNQRFIVKFEYGAGKDGYWSYEQMVIQTEDYLDILKALYPQYDYKTLFDHSCGHDRQREDGLNKNKLGKGWGGANPKLRSSEITREEGYLGQFNHAKKLKVGETQSMVFADDNLDGPWWLTPVQREATRLDQNLGEQKPQPKNMEELKKDLALKGISSAGQSADLKKRAENNGIVTTKHCDKIKEGWAFKPKGSFQILWERGWIDPEKSAKDYTVLGKKDGHGNTIKETSLDYLMSLQYDFAHEETMLQYHVRKMGATVDRTPKAHCEIAGEGIEYCWGRGKNKYRGLPMKEKTGKKKFRGSVDHCFGREVLTPEFARACSKRSRSYMVAYKALKEVPLDGYDPSADKTHESTDRQTPIKLEKVRKLIKTHRCVMDFDLKFIKAAPA